MYRELSTQEHHIKQNHLESEKYIPHLFIDT